MLSSQRCSSFVNNSARNFNGRYCIGKTLLWHCDFLHSVEAVDFLLSGLQAGLIAKLTDLGFSKGIIGETIVSTYSSDGKPNAAPMGVVMKNERHIIINLFNSSTTCKNIKTKRCAVVNLTSNIEVFYKTAFKEANPDGQLPHEWFEKAVEVDAPRLSLADASIEVSVKALVPSEAEKTSAIFNVDLIRATRKYPQIYCRAMTQTLEAIIHATRVKALISEGKESSHVSKLLDMIVDCNNVVSRLAPNSSYFLVMADLMKRVEVWTEQK